MAICRARHSIVLILQLVILVYGAGAQDDDFNHILIKVPKLKRSEGRITLEYTQQEQTVRHQLAFSEVIDSETSRSRVSIGYVGYKPRVYYSRAGDILTVSKEAACHSIKQMGHKFVPELDWFLRLTYTQAELDNGLPPAHRHQIGPTGITIMLPKKVSRLDEQPAPISRARTLTIASFIPADLLRP